MRGLAFCTILYGTLYLVWHMYCLCVLFDNAWWSPFNYWGEKVGSACGGVALLLEMEQVLSLANMASNGVHRAIGCLTYVLPHKRTQYVVAVSF